MLTTAAVLLTAIVFGGMVLYSFGFAAFLFKTLPAEDAGSILRKAFPVFYVWCIAVALIAAVPLWFVDPLSAWLTITVALTTMPLRQLLMPAINSASDNKNRRRFNLLHGLSVLAALAQMAVLGYVLARIAT
ncbi:DUF4149 domain-containing protein [Luminiphilus sp. nBUS_07]|uniref:DUF4149 domain-containing protein n=1 Tax=Luminiphilus sp. nBUS_07 TaxID=3395314 RepID=UPI003EB989FC